jgi:hypothetical protein
MVSDGASSRSAGRRSHAYDIVPVQSVRSRMESWSRSGMCGSRAQRRAVYHRFTCRCAALDMDVDMRTRILSRTTDKAPPENEVCFPCVLLRKSPPWARRCARTICARSVLSHSAMATRVTHVPYAEGRRSCQRDRKVFAGLVDTRYIYLSFSASRPEHGCRVVNSARARHASRTCRRRLVVDRRPQRGMRSLRRAVHRAMHALQGGILLRANAPCAGEHLPLARSRCTSDWARLRSTRHHTTWSVGSRAPSPRAARSTRYSSPRTPRRRGSSSCSTLCGAEGTERPG